MSHKAAKKSRHRPEEELTQREFRRFVLKVEGYYAVHPPMNERVYRGKQALTKSPEDGVWRPIASVEPAGVQV